MKHFFALLLFFFSLVAFGQELPVMTYNLRLDLASDGENAWPKRKEFLVSQIQFYEPGIFGTQEGLPHQLSYINNELKDYKMLGVGREGGNKGEYSAIFYNALKYDTLETSTFWLSETPEKVSKGWDAAYLRVCTYGLFKDKKTKKKFWVFNTHLDNEGEEARYKGMELILNTISFLNTKNYPVILMGDFNSIPDSRVITNLKTKMTDAREVSSETPFGSFGTFNGFKFCEPVQNRIDYIFISNGGKIKVNKYAVLTDSKDMKYPSDHFPVFAELLFK